jgi:ParB family chromosome partitioning protein
MEKNIYYISPDLISPNIYQPRKHFNEETIDELAQSIKVYGIIQPLTVRKLSHDRYELVAGERRLRASKKLGLSEVPVILIDITDKDSAAIALLENLQREDLNYIEEAEAYYNLIKDHSYTQEQLAEVIGKKQSTIANKIRLLKLDAEVRLMLLENKLTERHARALLKLSDPEMQLSILKIVISKNLNVKKTEELIERELLKLTHQQIAADTKKRIKGFFPTKLYINTVRQVFDKAGISAEYTSKDSDDWIEITVKIPKN